VGSDVGGLKEFCSLVVLMMGIDCLGLFTLYVDVLAVIVEVSRLPWCLLKCHFGFVPSIQVHCVKAMCA